MENECAWCGTDFKNNYLILEYKNNYYCDEDCLIHDIGVRICLFKNSENEDN